MWYVLWVRLLAYVKDKYCLVDSASTMGITVNGVRIGKRDNKKSTS